MRFLRSILRLGKPREYANDFLWLHGKPCQTCKHAEFCQRGCRKYETWRTAKPEAR